MATKHNWTEETDAIEKATERALRKIGIVISGRAMVLVPVDSGRLRGSITYAVTDKQSDIQTPAEQKDKIKRPTSKRELFIGSNVEYAQHVEYGTRSGSGFGLGGTRGMVAQPYLRPALDENRKNARKIYRAEISKAFKGK